MEFEDYRRFVREVSTQKIKGQKERVTWAVMELASEANECLGVVTKAARKGSSIDRIKLFDELGDTLWGIAAVLNEEFPEMTLDDLMISNKEKLEKRIAATKTD